jgi:hypothetical protein
VRSWQEQMPGTAATVPGFFLVAAVLYYRKYRTLSTVCVGNIFNR